MGLLDWLVRKGSSPDPVPVEQAVLIRLPLSDDEFGVEGERAAIHALATDIAAAIAESGTGEYDGDEFGDGQCTLYLYGPDADRLWSAVEGPVREAEVSRGARVTKRYGGPSPNTRSEQVEL